MSEYGYQANRHQLKNSCRGVDPRYVATTLDRKPRRYYIVKTGQNAQSAPQNTERHSAVKSGLTQIFAIAVFSLTLATGTSAAGEKCHKIIEEFVLTSTRISRDYPNPAERQELLKAALNDLARNARAVYGPFCPCNELLEKAVALQRHREGWRSPPAGWEPRGFRATFLPLEVEIASEDVRLLMDLTSLCNGH
ncbi:MAG: hypothetical protein HY913_03770 [Desulfomonile tiedjei]|nr:hypothetical protein [Desulfomonile tiedjei]